MPVTVDLSTVEKVQQKKVIVDVKQRIADEISAIDDNLAAVGNVTTIANVRTALTIVLQRQRRIMRALAYLAERVD